MSQNITKDGVEVTVGQVWRDLDKRMEGRERRVAAIVDGKVIMEPLGADGTTTKVSISRMHKHSTGWQLVK